jgi:predicted RNase H-like HicB family nuclease
MKSTIAIETGSKMASFGVDVPDLPGCFRAGATVEEAFDSARETIEAHREMLAEDGEETPVPEAMSEWQKSRDYRVGPGASSKSQLSTLSVQSRRSTSLCLVACSSNSIKT